MSLIATAERTFEEPVVGCTRGQFIPIVFATKLNVGSCEVMHRMYGFDHYRILIIIIGASLLSTHRLPRKAFRRPPAATPQGRHPPPRVAGAAAPAGRQHRDQGRRRRQVERGGSDHSPGGPSSCRTRKHGGSKRQVWRRIHIGIDERTLQIRAANLTTSDVGEAPMLPERLDQIPPDQEIGSVNADGASNTCKGHDALPGHGAWAVIPPRKTAKP